MAFLVNVGRLMVKQAAWPLHLSSLSFLTGNTGDFLQDADGGFLVE